MSETPPAGSDPSRDRRAAYDYVGGDVERPDLVADLRARIAGDVRFDEYTRTLYATDASAYEVTPVGVVFPTSTADVASVVEYCAEADIPVLPRGGGTSLGGQAVNEAVVLDCSRYMDELVAVDADAATAIAEPGIYLGDLDAALADDGLHFGPDPAWGDKSTLGGAIGNNSTGAHSLQYGKTDAYVESCEVVLADGTVTTLGEVDLATVRERADPEGDVESRLYATVARIVDEEAPAIERAFPDLKRNVSGYNLDWLVEEAESGSVNLARLVCGSEGTLCVVTRATVGLEPRPPAKAMALLRYETLGDAMADVAPVLEHDPAAVEVLDDVLLDLARDTTEFGPLVAEMVPEGTGAVLLVEFFAADDGEGRERVADLLADRSPTTTASAVPAAGAGDRTDAPPRAVGADEAHADHERERFWKLRKSGLPILLGRTTDAKHVSFIEDTAVPPENLPGFVADFQDVLDQHDTYACFYAHAGPGCLHIRPLVNTKTEAGVERLEAIADAATDLVVEYDGSVSGEHGDGRARTQWNRKLYGDHVWTLFRELKTAVDPEWLLNPGQVCGYAPAETRPAEAPARADAVRMTEDLRFDPNHDLDLGFEPALSWDTANGMAGMVELCHGCGGCRGPQGTTGGVMCPTFRAAEEEITSTRGRANMLRQAMDGDLPADPTSEEFLTEVLDLCIGCKGCARDCPSEVDMAKLKAEVTHAHHRREGASLRARLFAHFHRLARVGSALAPVSNWLARLPGADALLERTLGIARQRDLPTFERQSVTDWFAARGPRVPADRAARRALLVPDTYSNYTEPAVATAAVRVLEAADVHVQVATATTATGRAAFSKGFLDVARERAAHNVAALEPKVEDGWDVVLVEPSAAVMLQSDYLDLLDGEDAATVAEATYGVCEYLDRFRLDDAIAFDASTEPITYHGHCHQTAVSRDHHAVGVLRRAGYDVTALDSGCCGMAGSFGYEAEHVAMSEAIGSILADQLADAPGREVAAPGTSCRSQLEALDVPDDPAHPVAYLDRALSGSGDR